MLGIRRVGHCAIDLWCGDPADFVADRYETDAEALSASAGQHLAILPGQTRKPADFFHTLACTLDQERNGLPRRITVILPDSPTYKLYQEGFFATFPEEDES